MAIRPIAPIAVPAASMCPLSKCTATRIHTKARVHFETVDGKATITRIYLDTEAQVPGISEEDFLEQADGAKKGCPVSRALTGVEIHLNAKLIA